MATPGQIQSIALFIPSHSGGLWDRRQMLLAFGSGAFYVLTVSHRLHTRRRVFKKKSMCFILSFCYLHGKRLHESIDANTEIGPHSNHANPSVGYLAQNCDGMQTSANRSWRYTLSIKLSGLCTDMCHTLMFCDAPESLNGQQCSLSLSSCSL